MRSKVKVRNFEIKFSLKNYKFVRLDNTNIYSNKEEYIKCNVCTKS